MYVSSLLPEGALVPASKRLGHLGHAETPYICGKVLVELVLSVLRQSLLREGFLRQKKLRGCHGLRSVNAFIRAAGSIQEYHTCEGLKSKHGFGKINTRRGIQPRLFFCYWTCYMVSCTQSSSDQQPRFAELGSLLSVGA